MTEALHHRESSGLVREGRSIDAVYFNIFNASLGPTIGFILLFGIPFYPGASPLLTIAITGALCIGINVTYALFASTMPRSGGEYVFMSRTIHPWLGFVANASSVFWITFYIGTAGALFGQLGLSAAFRMLAEANGNTGWVASTADWFYTDWGLLVSGLIMMALTMPVVIFSRHGLRNYFRFQKWVLAFCAVTLVGTIVAILLMSHDSFVTSFNNYASTFTGSGNAYNDVLKEGGSAPGFDWEQTILAAAWPFYGLAFTIQSAYWAGEAKRGVRTHLTGMTLTFGIAFVVLLIAVAVSLNSFSIDFLNAVGLADPSVYGMTFAPYYVELVGTWTGPVLGIIFALGLSAWFIMYAPLLTIMASRSLLAWSFDGVVPERLGRVSPRTNNPLNATLVIAVCAVGFLVLYAFTSLFTVVSAQLAFIVTFGITCAAGMIFPFRRRDLFESSPARFRVLGIPLITITGIAGTLGATALAIIFLRDPSSGANWPLNKSQIYGIIAVFAGAALIYGISALRRRRDGIDLGLAYRELPPD